MIIKFKNANSQKRSKSAETVLNDEKRIQKNMQSPI